VAHSKEEEIGRKRREKGGKERRKEEKEREEGKGDLKIG
jgi:hypothetical protein